VKDPVAAYHELLDDDRLTAASAQPPASGQRAGRTFNGRAVMP
jgi:hypothetical protein